MKRILAALFCGLIILALACTLVAVETMSGDEEHATLSKLPTVESAKALLNSTHRHGEWHRIQAGSSEVLTWVVYPDRSNKAPIVVISAEDQKMTDWLRAVADQVGLEGFIVAVPDLMAGAGPENRAVRDYIAALPASNGRTATLTFSHDRITVLAGDQKSSFGLSERIWPEVISFLNAVTENHPAFGAMQEHMTHMAVESAPPAPAQARGPQAPRYPTGKPDNLVAGSFNAKSTWMKSPRRAEWVDIPVGTVKLHTRIVYPDGNEKAPIVIVMQHGTGLDDWMLALSDQLAYHGFIAVAPDMHSGFGPNGGNYDSFQYIDEAMRANARFTRDETMRRFKAARDYGLKLPRSNGKTASIGFCMGGGNSFAFAGEVPEHNASVVFYGGGPDEATMAKIKAPVIGFYGEDDVRLTSTVEKTAADMKRLGKSYEYHIYPHATHVFLEFQDLGGNPEAVADAWPRAMAFIKEHTKN
jgi:carboxymethylenebutenolidase